MTASTRTVCLSLCALLIAGGASASPPLFHSKYVSYATSIYTANLAGADFNEDGRPDLVLGTGNFSNDSAVVHFATADGRLSAPLTIPTLERSGWPLLNAARLDDDAHADIVIVGQNEIVVIRGHGDGAFDPPHVAFARPGTYGVPQFADVDGDGHTDVVLATYDSAAVRIVRGDGAGGLSTSWLVPAVDDIRAVAVGDLDADGIPDLVARADSAIVTLRGHGDGSFDPPQLLLSGAPVSGILLSDVNGDGVLDVVAGPAPGVLTGHGDGTFDPPRPFEIPCWTMADFDGDGHLDVAGRPQTGKPAGIGIQLGHGDGSFDPPVYFAAPVDAWDLVAADFNGDGRVDLAVLGQNLRGVSVLAGNGDGTFGTARSFPAGGDPVPLVLGDVDGDGRPDAIAGVPGGVAILHGLPGATFDAAAVYPAPAPVSLVAADLDGDGRADVVAADAASVHVWRGGATGLGPRLDLATPGGTVDLAAADLDGDGDVDLVTGNGGSYSVWLGNGDGTFATRTDFTGSCSAVAIGDMNGDGRPDLVSTPNVQVRLGNGSGAFGPPASVTVSTMTTRLALGDLDHDGDLDVVATGGQTVYVLPGSPTGALGSARSYPTPNTKHRVVVADFDGDGNLDFATTRGSPGAVGVWFGKGDGTVRSDPSGRYFEEVHGVGDGTSSTVAPGVAVADLDGNGGPDLLVASPGDGTLALLLNRLHGAAGVPSPGPPPRFTLAVRPQPVRGPLRVELGASAAGTARVELLDVAGRRITAIDRVLVVGRQSFELAVRRALAPGVYLVRARVGSQVRTARAVVI